MRKRETFDQVHQFVENELGIKEYGFTRLIIPNFEDRSSFVKTVNWDITNYLAVNYVTRYGETNISAILTFYITLNEVNRIFYNVYDKFHKPIFPETPRSTLHSFPGLITNNSDALIEMQNLVIIKENVINYSLLQICCDQIKRYIAEFVYPFFSSVNSIQVINDEIINKVPHMEVSNYLDSGNAPWLKLIIMKLCENPGYEDYKKWLEETLARLLPTNPTMYEPMQKIYQELRQLLDSGQYLSLIQNID